ncbi:MAG: hypothetical protein K2Q20_08130 [Phycisphaerales bacterium]|nr:hypothetical protein [Phycisphaerales bacterium]
MHGSPESPHQTNPTHHALTLVKGPHRWSFRCAPGEEPLLLERLAELARRKDVPFDWFDAALVSHQLRSRLNAGIAREPADASPVVIAKPRRNPA